MRLQALLPLALLSAVAVCQDDSSTDYDLWGPGEDPVEFSDGNFTEPTATTTVYGEGASMNVSWDTTYENSNLYLIVGWDFGTPVQLATGSSQKWYQWDVHTDSKNTSQIYAFRIVNAQGTSDEQANGGFLSASFYIGDNDGTADDPTTTATTLTTSASVPVATATSGLAVTSPAEATSSSTPTTTPTVETGLSSGAKTGLGVGIGVGVVGIAALLAALWFWRKSKKGGGKNTNSQEAYEPYSGGSPQTVFNEGPPQPYDPNAPAYNANQQALMGYYKPGRPAQPAEMEAARGTELDGGQHHLCTPEAYTDNNAARPPTHSPAPTHLTASTHSPAQQQPVELQ
ncbi:Uu.00g076260.m01.CDS01 [Anthostomella pinea]|uniref:Uu.00g076260.m01.CDS01 n=1 Tax=Anthostomella pinea TaxID=933095 RepID=A0AAI8VVU5_9PEZI|nr:Uu.00g076260.m01.CDS01 [Anthostomella pinea]